MPSTTWICEDRQVLERLDRIRKEHHPHLQEARILVLFTEPAPKRGGKIVLGKASRPSAKDKALLGRDVDFLITLSSDEWHGQTERHKAALLDHELSHCGRKETERFTKDPETGKKVSVIVRKWVLLGHDIEEFNHILQRHGAWKDDIRETVQILGQLKLWPDPDPAKDLARHVALQDDVEKKLDDILEKAGVEASRIQKNVTVTLTAAHGPVLKEAAEQLRGRELVNA